MSDRPTVAAPRRALVTGSSGFVGSHLVEALAADRWTVDRLLRPGSPPPPADGPASGNAGDGRDWRAPLDDAPALARALAAAADRGGGWDAVFHVAGVTRAHGVAAFRAGNVAPTRALLDALAARPGAAGRLVLVSSQAAAGPAPARDRPRTEADPPAPVGAYGASKREAERVVETHPGGLPWAIVRPAAVYGPRDRDFLAVFRQAARGVGVYPHTRHAWLSLVYAGDLARALVAAGTAPAALGRALFVAGDEAVPWPAVYGAAAAAAGRRLRVEWDAPAWLVEAAGRAGDVWAGLTGRAVLVGREKVRLGRPRWWLCSAAAARLALGWAPRVGLAEGARLTHAWYAARGLV